MSAHSEGFYVTGGTLRSDAPSYVERRADADVCHALLNHEFCYVLTSRQMGKSSLMVRTASKLRAQGVNVIALDLGAIGQNLTPDQWYTGLLVSIGEQLDLERELDQFWAASLHLSPVQSWFAAIRKIVLGTRPNPVVIFLDEIDSVLSLPFSTDEFFAGIRETYNRRSTDPVFERLTFCLMGVATPSDLIRDTRMTPFNIGRRIELDDFTATEATPLAKGLHLEQTHATALLDRVLYWTNGHPYLTQRLCQSLAGTIQATIHDVDRLCQELFLINSARQRDDNLIFVRERLLRNQPDLTGLLALYVDVWRGRRVADEESNPRVSVLRLSGVVRSAHGYLCRRNRIYHHVFDADWARSNLPDAEVRRRRAAFWKGALGVGGIAVAVVAAMAFMLFVSLKEKRNAYVAEATAALMTGHQGQHYDSLDAISKADWFFSDKSNLCNLAVQSLSLFDLRETSSSSLWRRDTRCFALNDDFTLYARGDAQGAVTVGDLAQRTDSIDLPARRLPAASVLFSPNGRYLAVQHEENQSGQIIVWDWRNRRALLTVTDCSPGRALDFSADSRKVACGRAKGRLSIYSLEKDSPATEVLCLTNVLQQPANCLRFDPTGRRLAVSSGSSLNVQIWDLDTGRALEPLYHRGPVLDLAWHPDGELLAAACRSGEIYIWHVSRPVISRILGKHDGEVRRLAFSHQGDLLVSSGADRTVRLWNPFTGRQVTSQLRPDEEIEAFVFSTKDERLGACRAGENIRFWEVNPARGYRVMLARSGPSQQVRTADFSPDGRLLAAASNDGIVLWDVVSGRKLVDLAEEVSTHSAFFDPRSGDLFATSSLYGWRCWRPVVASNAASLHLEPINTRSYLPDNLGPFAMSSDGKMAVALHASNQFYAFPTDKPAKAVLRVTGTNHYQAVALSPDGKYLAACTTPELSDSSQAESVHLWDLATGTQIVTPRPLDPGPYFGFSPSGSWFVTTSPETVHFWTAGNWQEGPEFKGCSGPFAFSGDGSVFAATEGGSVIQLFRMADKKPFVRLENPDRKRVRALSFSREGDKLAAVSSDQLVLLWDLALLSRDLAELHLYGRLPVFPDSTNYELTQNFGWASGL